MLTLHAPAHLLTEGEGLRARHPDLLGHLFATSGTTGSPKWVLHSEAGLDHCARVVNEHFDCTSEDTWGLALPEFHVGGYCLTHRARLAGGRLTRFAQRWNAVEFTNWLRQENVTVTSLVPTQVHDLIKSKQSCPSQLRVALIGGARLPNALFVEAVALGWPLVVSYGMTETAGLVAASRPLSRELHPLPGWHLDTTAHELLTISGAGLFSGYLTQEQFLPTPCSFVASDRVRIKGGNLTILGRADDQVKILGELVDTQHLQDLLAQVVPGQATTILTLPDDRCGQFLYPMVEGPSDDGLAEKIMQWNKTLPPFSRLQAPSFVSSFPRTDLGKIDRRALTLLLPERHSSPLPSQEDESYPQGS